MAGPVWKIKPPLESPSAGLWIGPGAHKPKDGIWLGSVAELTQGRTPHVWLSTAKEQVAAVVGKRGSGKSFTLGVFAEGMALSSGAEHVSRQSRPRAVLLFDPLDVYWTTRFAIGPSANDEAQRHYELADAAKLTGLTFDVEAWVP